MAICRHCQSKFVNRPKGLCFSCYYTPGVRGLYRSQSKFGKHGIGLGNAPKPAAGPTGCLPGTLRKMVVMRRRAMAGQTIWHPLDARHED